MSDAHNARPVENTGADEGAHDGGSGNAGANAAHATASDIGPAFEFVNDDRSENFDLRPRTDFHGPIPDDQAKISRDVYEIRNVLKLIKDNRAIVAEETYNEFIERVVQAGSAGCAAPHVYPSLASGALEQIRQGLVRRIGTPIAYRYLRTLAGWALLGAVLGLVIVVIGPLVWPPVRPFGWVLIGAMAGAWFSVAASRRQIAFETIPDYIDTQYEPMVRMLFVTTLAGVFALFLHVQVLAIKIGSTDLGSFTHSASVAILVGLIAGIGERALSVQLIDKAQKVLNPKAG